ncbi:MAG: hypothetical protein RBG13Loki_2962 [Promethearchaeota archaeon CR_4]|nr:MAG: hypothetical protein RBG13Loki_2962 [Candidatus Lokiarchaeota archaeon CR_4]
MHLVRPNLALAPFDVLDVFCFLHKIFCSHDCLPVGNGILNASHFHEKLKPGEIEEVCLVEGDDFHGLVTHIVYNPFLNRGVKS